MKKFTLFFTLLLLTALSYTAKAAVSRTVDCSSGYLATLANSYLTYVTNLTVTGTIDARDFKTLRDDMPMLEVIDLSGCRVVAYTGTEGTKGTTTISYPANGIPDYAFRKPYAYSGKASLKTFIYPLLISSIGDFAFYNCSEFVGSLTIPETVTSIGVCSFSQCRKINGSINIPSSVITIGNRAFVECSGFIEVDKDNPNYSSLEGVLFDKNKTTLLQCPISKTGNYLIPSTVTNIIFSSFRSCQGFTGTITIPQSVTKIDDETFRTCSGLIAVEQNNPNYSSLDGILYNKDKTILIHCPYSRTGTLTIPLSVIIIGEFAFENCRHLTGSLTIPSSVTTIDRYAFYFCEGFTGSLTIPSSVTTIGDNAFYGCSSLTGTLTIPSSVTTIGSSAFCQCRGFTGPLLIPTSVKTISSSVFRDCSGLTGSLTIPSSVTTIGSSAFEGCYGFKDTLTIPSSVSTIATNAFKNCSGFNSLYALSTKPIDIRGSSSVFLGVKKTIPLHVPVGSKSCYESAYQWQDFWTIVGDIVATSIGVVHDSKTISIYPNPSSNFITISELSSLVDVKNISIVDVSGTTLFVRDIDPTINTLPINVSTFANGIYFVSIETNSGRLLKRFVKE